MTQSVVVVARASSDLQLSLCHAIETPKNHLKWTKRTKVEILEGGVEPLQNDAEAELTLRKDETAKLNLNLNFESDLDLNTFSAAVAVAACKVDDETHTDVVIGVGLVETQIENSSDSNYSAMGVEMALGEMIEIAAGVVNGAVVAALIEIETETEIGIGIGIAAIGLLHDFAKAQRAEAEVADESELALKWQNHILDVNMELKLNLVVGCIRTEVKVQMRNSKEDEDGNWGRQPT